MATSGAPAKRRGRFTAAFVIGLLTTLVGSELAVRASAGRLSEPQIYFSGPAQTAIHDMDVLAAAGITSDITFVGTSFVRRGIAADRFEGKFADSDYVHNLALPGAQTPVVERWLLDEVVPRLHPKRVVWGVSSIDFNAGRPNRTIEQYLDARASEPGWIAALDRALLSIALSEHRDELRDPASLIEAARGNRERFTRQRPLGRRAVWDLGFRDLSDAQLDRMRENHRITVRDKQLVNFRVGDEELNAFRRTLRALREQGIEVVVVVMPIPTSFRELHPGGPEQFEELRDLVLAESEAAGVDALDLSSSMDDDDFRDYEHLEVEAAEEFSDLLADRLRALGWR